MSSTVRVRQSLMAPMYGMFQTYKNPFVVSRASMQYMFDQNDVPHLDLLANNLSISVGHCHPRVREKTSEQLNRVAHISSMYYSEPAAKLTEKFLATFPERSDGEKWQVQYAVTGTEAVEMAIQMARVVTGSPQMLSLQNSYHGSIGTAMGASGITACTHALPETQFIHHLPAPIYEMKDKTEFLLDQAQMTIDASTPGNVAGFIFEAIQGYGGIHILPHDYLQKMAKVTKDHGGLLIADEVQSGLGRMGTTYWSYEMSGVEPDIVVVAKGLSNGHPLSAIVAKESVFAKYMEKQKFVFFTYGANPVSCAAAHEVLSVIEDEKIQEHAHDLGQVFGKMMSKVAVDYPHLVVEVRGQGLMWGVELDDKVAANIYEEMKDRQILVGLGGTKKNVLRFMPPMCVNEENIKEFVSVLTSVLDTY